MKVTFVLPFDGRRPVGGVKVAYEYANQLVKVGHDVTLVHPAGLYLGSGKNDRWFRNIGKFVIYGLTRKYLPSDWFDLDPRVIVRWVPSLHVRHIPKSNAVVATAWETAEWVSGYPHDRGHKFYLIQHFEDWCGDRQRVLNTWKLSLDKIVISRWLGNIAKSVGESFIYIPNGLDFERFGVDIAPEQRNSKHVLMLYHYLDWKGSKEGLAVLKVVKEKAPDIHVTLFGVVSPQPGELPEWIRFERLPSKQRLRELYNDAAIFVSPSWAEGWALPPAEAMQCGCATVLTDIGGHEYAIDGKTSLLSAPKDVEQMALHLLTLLQNNDLRIRLAHAAVAEIAQYTWPRATKSLETFFLERIYGLRHST